VVGGLSGTGKSTIAQALASTIGRTPGAVVLRSDIVRKTIMGVALARAFGCERLHAVRDPAGLHDLAQRWLKKRWRLAIRSSSTLSARKPSEREALEGVARAVECHFAGVWLDAPLDVRLERIGRRRDDPSDADARGRAPPGGLRACTTSNGRASMRAGPSMMCWARFAPWWTG
jgi:predicted kinase